MDEPFYDDGFCLQKCPNSLKFISRETSPFNALLYKCVSSCSKYVSLNNLCVDMCQTNEVLYANACLLQCPKSDPFHVHLPVKDRGKVNITSSYEIQQPISAFVVCASKCPHNFVMDSGECYADCFNSSRKMIHNSSCFEKCPTDHPYMTKTGSNFLCSSFCIHRRFHLDCVENCPSSDTSVNEGECVNCTEIGMFEQGEECVNKCSKFMYENKCYDSCPSIAQFTFNNTCFRTCPDNVSLVDEQHYSNDALFVCVENCPGFKYVLGNQCVLKCPSYKQYHIEGKCISCQDIGKFDDGKKCADVCPEIGYNFRCIKQCPYGTKLYNKSCVMTCPSDMPVQLHDWKKGYYCEIKCPSGMFLFDTYCTYNCYGRYSRNYVYNDTCVDKCPSQASYLKSFRKYSRLLYHCVEDCEQGQVKLNKNCYNSCPENYHVFDGNCVLKCPREVPFIYRGHCVKNCSHYKLGFNCYDDCPPHLYRDNGTCLVTCPVHRPYDYHRNCTENCKINTYKMDGSCIDDCPPHLYRDNGTCLVTCPVHQPYDYHRNCTENCKINTYKMDRSCIDDCPLHLYRDNGTCLVTCPVHRPYDYERDCLESCKNNTYEADKSCYDTCPPGSFGYRDKCLPKCPTEAKFEYLGLCKERCPNTTISFNNTCISRCPKNKVEFQRRCIDECPELASFNNEGSCVSSCPNVKLGKKCYEDCPNKMNAYEKECVEKCPKHADFINKKNCVKRCPSYHIYLNCVNKCPENTYPHGMQCKSDCPKEAPFKKIGLFERNGDCLSSCGDYYLAAENMTCMRKSECKEYIDDIWCRKKCPLHTYLLYFEDQKYCKSLHPVYVWSGIFFIIIAADVAFGIRLLIYGRRILKENENEKKEELEVGEINVGSENKKHLTAMEMYNTRHIDKSKKKWEDVVNVTVKIEEIGKSKVLSVYCHLNEKARPFVKNVEVWIVWWRAQTGEKFKMIGGTTAR
ncbi:proprotein convertase subtilisin/kexin type 5-like [Saccostrea echinata]|uniref:proprotein convertase subtilisin/kexin type 5-like n=1 Tax=Saccostrea echinata TaxID=191078 RepID=UPI002A81FDD3|nr:proprotein convertase subtilisin/kexin type 5-like [Saccostrea echinata]